VTEILPERDAELLAGQQQAKECVAAIATRVRACAARDLALDHLGAQIPFRAVSVQRHLWPVQNQQQLLLVRVQPGQQPIEGGKAGAAAEDAVEPRPQLAPAPLVRRAAVGLQVGVEPPDQGAQELLRSVLPVGEGIELMDQPLGMDPAQSVPVDGELAGVIGQDGGVGQEAVALILPQSAPSVAIRTGSGVTLSAVMPSRSRCPIQAPASSKFRSGCASSLAITGPARAR
jgi:hypothetical protein